MKTKRTAARMTHLNISKLNRYFLSATTRELMEATIQLSEKVPIFKEKLKKIILENRVKGD